MKKIIWTSVITLFVILIAVGSYILNPLMPIITGYGAKNMCSNVFISERHEDSIRSIDLNFMPIKYSSIKVNYEEKSVTSRFLWHTSKAIYRPEFGAVLLSGANEADLRNTPFPITRRTLCTTPELTHSTYVGVNKARIDSISHAHIDLRNYGGTPFSFMVLHKGQIIAEKYKKGINADTRLLSWSMGKSITSALAGMLTMSHGLDINKGNLFPEWAGDERRNITISHLMQMESGLEWNENYGSESDVNLMLHTATDMAAYTINKPAAHAPNTHWLYSSGSTNAVSLALRNHIGCDSTYYDLAINHLFHKLGAHTAIFESDPSGTLLGSSYVYARTTDFARFGQLYLDNGQINGEQILPQDWTAYATTPAANSEGKYGAGFWLNQGGEYASLPRDIYSCRGHDGQYIIVIPSHQLVVTTLGYSPKKRNPIDIERLLTDIISCVE